MTGAITFDLLARDHASAAVRKVGDELETLNGRATHFAKGFAASLGLAFGAEKLVEFGRSAVSAFAAAQAGEARLQNAFKTFPKLADTNRAALDKLNASIERRTGFLTRDLAAGEANLAQFDLTGAQLKQITPLLVDYADKTGTAIPESATLLGRALLGNQRALKSIGITMPTVTASAKDLAKAHHEVESTSTTLKNAQDHLTLSIAEMRDKRKVTAADEIRYKDAQNAVRDAYAKNQAALASLRGEQDHAAKSGSYFDQVVTALKGKVGGFADQESQTAQGQLRKLSAEFDRVKVEVGAKLLPVVLSLGHFLTGTLIPDLEHTASWLKRNSDVIVPLAKFVGGLAIAIYATNKATALWTITTRAATSWTKLLGRESVVTAGKTASIGAASAAAQTTVVASTEAGTAAIATEGAAATATAGRIAGAMSAARGLLAMGPALLGMANLISNPKSLGIPFGFNNDLNVGKGKNVKLTGYLDSAGNLYSDPGLKHRIGGSSGSSGGGVDPTLAALLRTPLGPSDGRGNDLPAHGTANRVIASSIFASQTSSRGGASSIKDILAGLPQFAVGSGTGIADGIAKGIKQREQAALSAAKSLASKLKSQINSIRSTMSQFTSGIVGTITGNAGLLNTGNQSVAGIINFEKHQLTIDQTFHRNLAKLAKLGYKPSYISELAQAGPEQAGNIAAQLATASTSQRNEINRIGRAIGVSAQGTADVAAHAYYSRQAHQMDALEKQLKAVNANIKAITADLASLQRTGHLQTRVAKK